MMEVVDNGPGIGGDVIDDILDFSVRVSSREAYVGPWRGAQGNALKTLVAMPFALDGKAGLFEIRSRGIRHLIRMSIDPIAQQPAIEVVRKASLVKIGTAVRVHWPVLPWSMGNLEADFSRIALLAEQYAFFNPHLRLACRITGYGRIWEPTDPGWKRWRPSEPLVAEWYDDARFERLFCALLNADRKSGRVRPVRDMIGDFRGLSSTGKRKQLMAELGLARASLEDLVMGDGAPDRERLAKLLAAMKQPRHRTEGGCARHHRQGPHRPAAAVEREGARKLRVPEGRRSKTRSRPRSPSLPSRTMLRPCTVDRCSAGSIPARRCWGALRSATIGGCGSLGSLLSEQSACAGHPLAFAACKNGPA